MADLDFEMRLGRLFAEAPALVDGDQFAKRVEDRLERSWTLRRVLIGAAGLGGGLIVAGQMIGPQINQRIETISLAPVSTIQRGIEALTPHWKVFSYLPYSSELLWMAAGLAALGVAAMAKRSIEEF
jgi:membrane-associated protease RseP (regulator of RpoE activity)